MTFEPDYYVYNNWRRNRGRVHRADCPHCNHGKGKAEKTYGTNDEWRGPFRREDAFRDAESLKRREMKACDICQP
jgi:hypothetical protein